MVTESLINLFLPRTCVLCHALSDTKIDLCHACQRDLPFLQYGCCICSKPVAFAGLICGECLQNPPPYERTVALFTYQFPIDYLITTLKFANRLLHAQILGELLVGRLQKFYAQQKKPQLIIPLPLHRRRLRERGYNQPLEIARPVARKLNIPLDRFSCQRHKNTPPQAKLHARERHQNIKNAFTVTQPIPARHVAVIDDVVTTGSTMREFCRVLRKAGVEEIDVWCIARA